MNLTRLIRPRHIIKCFRYWFSDQVAGNSVLIKEKSILLIKTEAIGDYVLFRNFIQSIKQSNRFKNYTITLAGNEIWKPLALKYDRDAVDHFIFIDKNKFSNVSAYRKSKLQEINSSGYEFVINVTFSREFLMGDSIVKCTKAFNKIGMQGDSVSEIPFFKWIGNFFYTSRIQLSKQYFFEFDRNKQFFEQITGNAIDFAAPHFPDQKTRKPLAILLPGAQARYRRWSPLKFKEIAEFLNNKYGFNILICGGKEDFEAGELISGTQNNNYIQNRCGMDSLDLLPELLAEAAIVICNDSGTLHLAAALNTPAVCISNANHYGRFTPYPAEWNKPLRFVYPPSFLKKYKSEKKRIQAVKYGSDYAIDEINTEDVASHIKVLLA